MDSEQVFKSVYETILSRDTRYDGQYYVGIVTTGIFCRPSCRSRTPKPENVKVFKSIEEAQEAGFRPCKRCRPENPSKHGPDAEIVETVNKMIQHKYPDNLTLAYMAKELNMSLYHLQRVFKRTTGTTPSKKLLQKRMETAEGLLLKEEMPIAEISALIGFRSVSHFSSAFKKTTGYTPVEYRMNNQSCIRREK
ncbi:bifunctional transcriptional activator/DNA repair enzyme AdaA [Pseudalkalibacillus salsuginis]|uniref:bifunctional transcriptional activator/DNA repair enzyme AdaA n=1 Tax=Pseudalkalibacillus salsuginis TaxID=2910972 RepID=UPI001F412A2E|nr:Ada metal-binding domain-containing protein [Pseudalkalibacillus salsuginis]MCF6410316.1 helix-turn-helix domain-containing protein [Pseudalkalibacillus salsuginis]